jgi:release factor glutamine methyltransferase
LAKQIENSKIAAIDISEGAIGVAQSNVDTHEVGDRVKLFQGDLLDGLPKGSDRVHIIVSNPPYIGNNEIETVDENVKNHEPKVALFSGEHGTEIIERLIAQGPEYLVPGGYLIFETSPIVMEKCVNLVKANGAFSDVKVVKDYGDLERLVVAQLKS